MVFATAAALARRARRVGFNALTTKLAKKGFYKGKGAVSPGVRTRTGRFKVVPWKRPEYVVPASAHGVSAFAPYVERASVK
jgi:large subunit ribosomal protein L41|tara:strand:+ start:1167 stop:1409 length:243 start_codon:yes stop_codon:yes gene_type:complete